MNKITSAALSANWAAVFAAAAGICIAACGCAKQDDSGAASNQSSAPAPSNGAGPLGNQPPPKPGKSDYAAAAPVPPQAAPAKKTH